MSFLVISVLGPPGSGKGTQAEKLIAKYNLAYVNMGGILRELKEKNTPLSEEVSSYLDKGLLVPDEVIIKVLEDYLSGIGRLDGIVFDGFPRVLSQAKYFDEFLNQKGQQIDLVIYFTLSEDEIIKRLANRRTCSQCGRVFNLVTNPPQKEGICDSCGGQLIVRSDETPEAISNRLKQFKEKTLPVVEYYKNKGLVEEVDAQRPIEVIFEDIVARLRKRVLSNE